jgi:3-dehydroquinate synthase
MTKIKLKLKKEIDDSYEVLLEKDCLKKLPAFLKKEAIGKKYAIICDTKTKNLFGNSLLKYLKKNKVECSIFAFTPGEKSKTLETISKLAESIVNSGFSRKDAILALGGGVVGDTAGFLASILFRGIPYIHIPTTLLAMVDSAIGGKTGVDLEAGKNLVGTITQPKAVFIDTKYLDTLPEKQIRSGLGEIIKYGIIYDKKFFDFIDKNMEKIFKLEESIINHIIKRSVEIKQEVVEKDEKESGLRMILNYGHTYGHALEKQSNYTLLHGYAISIGMVIINKMAVEEGLLKESEAEKITQLFKKAGLPTTCMKKPSFKDLATDKKRDGNCINFVMVRKIGKSIIHKKKCL